MKAADNAKVASVKYVDEIVEDKMDMTAELTKTLDLKVKSLDALRAVHFRVDDVRELDLEEVNDLAKASMVESGIIVQKLGNASAAATVSFDGMEKARY